MAPGWCEARGHVWTLHPASLLQNHDAHALKGGFEGDLRVTRPQGLVLLCSDRNAIELGVVEHSLSTTEISS